MAEEKDITEKFLDYINKVLKDAKISGNHKEDSMHIGVEGPDWQEYLVVDIDFSIDKIKVKEILKGK